MTLFKVWWCPQQLHPYYSPNPNTKSSVTALKVHLFHSVHGVWKSQKKSHSTLRAKRATFTFWVDKSWLKMPKMVHFGEFLKTWSLRSNSVTREVSFNRTKIGGKCQNWKIQMQHFGWFSNTVQRFESPFIRAFQSCLKKEFLGSWGYFKVSKILILDMLTQQFTKLFFCHTL